MWIETRGKQERVYWRSGLPGKSKDYESFATREEAERFRQAARLAGGPEQAPQLLRQLQAGSDAALGCPSAAPAAPGTDARATQHLAPTTAAGEPARTAEVSVDKLAESYFSQKGGVTERTLNDERVSYRHHIQPYFDAVPIRLVRSKVLPGQPGPARPTPPAVPCRWPAGWAGWRPGSRCAAS